MEIVYVLALTLSNIACVIIGAKMGQKTAKGETIEMPSINPLEAYRKHEARKEAQAEQERIDTIVRNIESYDGTGNNQEDVGR